MVRAGSALKAAVSVLQYMQPAAQRPFLALYIYELSVWAGLMAELGRVVFSRDPTHHSPTHLDHWRRSTRIRQQANHRQGGKGRDRKGVTDRELLLAGGRGDRRVWRGFREGAEIESSG